MQTAPPGPYLSGCERGKNLGQTHGPQQPPPGRQAGGPHCHSRGRVGGGAHDLASAIVQGFQHEVKQLVVGFDSHIQVAPSDPSADGLVWSPGMLDSLRRLPGVAQVALRHERAGILESPQALQGVVVRGVDSTSVLDRIESGLLRGRLPEATTQGPRDVLIGEPLARAFDVDTGDKVMLYLVLGKEDIRPRPMKVAGIYQTGLQEFDQRQVWISAAQMQDAARAARKPKSCVRQQRWAARHVPLGKSLVETRGGWAGEGVGPNPDTDVAPFRFKTRLARTPTFGSQG